MAKVALLLAGIFGLGCGTFPIGGAGNVPSLATLQNSGNTNGLPAGLSNLLGGLSGRSLERHGKDGKGGKGKDGKGGKEGKGKGGKGKDGKGGKDSSNPLLSGITSLFELPGVDILSQILNGIIGLAGAAAAGTAAAGAISTFFPTITTTKLATIPSPITDIVGFLSSPTVSNLIQALLSGDVVGVLTNAATLAASLLFQQIQQAFPASG